MRMDAHCRRLSFWRVAMRYTPIAGELSDRVRGKSVHVATISFEGESDRPELIRFVRIFKSFLRANRLSKSLKPSIEINGEPHGAFKVLKTIDEMTDINVMFILPGLYAPEIIREYTRVSILLHKDHEVSVSFDTMRKQFQLDVAPARLH